VAVQPEYKSELGVESEVQESMVTSSDIAIGLLKHGAKTSWALKEKAGYKTAMAGKWFVNIIRIQ
jgi:hypothetical protein